MGLVDLLDETGSWLRHGELLELVHGLDGHLKLLGGLHGIIHLHKVLVHFLEVLVDKLVDYLWWEVYPDVEYSILISLFECLLEIFLNIGDNHVGPREVVCVPLSIRLSTLHLLLAQGSVCQQVIDELN